MKEPEQVFDIEQFEKNPEPFLETSKLIMPNPNHQPSVAHKFMKKLCDRNQILKIFTQNIDGLEKGATAVFIVKWSTIDTNLILVVYL